MTKVELKRLQEACSKIIKAIEGEIKVLSYLSDTLKDISNNHQKLTELVALIPDSVREDKNKNTLQ